jgi:hypothetical protein
MPSFILQIWIHVQVRQQCQIKSVILYVCKSRFILSFIVSFLQIFLIYRSGDYSYHAQSAMIDQNDYFWKRAPEDYCQSSQLFIFSTSIDRYSLL